MRKTQVETEAGNIPVTVTEEMRKAAAKLIIDGEAYKKATEQYETIRDRVHKKTVDAAIQVTTETLKELMHLTYQANPHLDPAGMKKNSSGIIKSREAEAAVMNKLNGLLKAEAHTRGIRDHICLEPDQLGSVARELF